MKKLLLSILILILYFSSNAQSPLRINKYLIDSLTGSGYWYLYHDSTHTGQWGLVAGSGGGGGSGTVTSVAQTFTGGLISVAGSPITTSGTLALTVAGTSGGIPYFSSISTWASSGLLAANAVMIGGGAGAAPSTTTTGTGVLTALGINVGSAGAFVTFNGAGGTPSSITLTNGTGLPISTGVSGLGTGVATALQVNVGTAGAFVVNGGALGTPSSGTLTNATGLPEGGLSLTDITTNNTSTSAHGFFPKLTSNTVYYVNNSGALTALALGASGTVLTSNGATSAPTFSAAAGGGLTVGTTTIASGTDKYALYNNAGVLGNYSGLQVNNTNNDVLITAGASTSVPLNIKGASSQSANYFNISTSSSTGDILNVNSSGEMIFAGNSDAGAFDMQLDKGLYVANVGAAENGLAIDDDEDASNMFVVQANTNIWDVSAGGRALRLSSGFGSGQPVIIAPGVNVTAATFSQVAQTMQLRFEYQQGQDVASTTGAMTLGVDGNVFEITGTNAITAIVNTNFQNGSMITLVFTSTASLTDGTANSGTSIGFELAGNTNFNATADDTITLVLSELGGTQRWREVCRSVN